MFQCFRRRKYLRCFGPRKTFKRSHALSKRRRFILKFILYSAIAILGIYVVRKLSSPITRALMRFLHVLSTISPIIFALFCLLLLVVGIPSFPVSFLIGLSYSPPLVYPFGIAVVYVGTMLNFYVARYWLAEKFNKKLRHNLFFIAINRVLSNKRSFIFLLLMRCSLLIPQNLLTIILALLKDGVSFSSCAITTFVGVWLTALLETYVGQTAQKVVEEGDVSDALHDADIPTWALLSTGVISLIAILVASIRISQVMKESKSEVTFSLRKAEASETEIELPQLTREKIL
ncbi:hypothetical protein PCE1_000346 [Barthelona sp. PCE]